MGTSGRDVICGRGGNDTLIGLGNNDLLLGGPGADTINGRTGRDRLLGGHGDDHLTGGPQKDDLDGGPGTNWCTPDDSDDATQCAYDLTAPTADSLWFSSDAVDVTDGDRQVTFRVHVIDDTGTRSVVVQPSADTPWFSGGYAELTSGTVRDGWWEGVLTFYRWSKPATFRPRLVLSDRIGRRASLAMDQPSVEVVDENPDLELPAVSLVGPAPEQTFDVRSTSAAVPVRARITDGLSGVDADSITMVLWAPRVNGAQTQAFGGSLRLSSGTIRDGVWTGEFEIPRNSVGGAWQLGIYVRDRASREARTARAIYWGPIEYAYQRWNSSEGVNQPFPDGRGSVTVIGRARTDSSAPVVSGVELSPDNIDTLNGPALVRVTVRARDLGSGVGGLAAFLIGGDSAWPQSGAPSAGLRLVDGSPNDGVWRGTIEVPQGYPPGIYYAWVPVWDVDNNEAQYLAAAHPYAEYHQHVLDTAATVSIGAERP